MLRLSRRFGALMSLALLVASAVMLADAPPAAAQGLDWFGGILGGGTPRRSPPPAYPGTRSGDGYGAGGSYGGYGDSGVERHKRRHHRDYGNDSDDRSPRPQRRQSQSQPRKKRPPDQTQQPAVVASPKKAAPTVYVDVFGDGLGQQLANGLDEAMADRPEVGIVHKARGSSGLVATYFYDWPKSIDEMLAKTDKRSPEKKTTATEKGSADKANKPEAREKIDVAVMMIGSNDRQPITQDGKTYQRGSDEWTAIYRKRVMGIAEAFKKRKIPLIWVGLPIMKDDDYGDDMAAFNEIYRDVAAKTGATYVDSWEVFSDDKGDFAAIGPDINGQIVRLRTTDGIYFTSAGSRKLAHFVETHIRRDLDGKTPLPQLPTAEAPTTDGKERSAKDNGSKDKAKTEKKPAVALARPEAGPIKNLVEPPSAKDGLLVQVPAGGADDIVPTSAPANRADNFRWPQTPPASAPPKASTKPPAP